METSIQPAYLEILTVLFVLFIINILPMYNHDVQNTIQLLKISIMVRQSDQQYIQGQYRTELDNDQSRT